jgi:glutaminase
MTALPPSEACPVQRILEDLFARHRSCCEGHVASYIPELARADPDKFGICVATIDGHLYEVGDSRHRFTTQSISKPFVYGLALDEHGLGPMARKVGVEPSGDAFNAISLAQEDGRPLNPMINAGAIATTGQVAAARPTDRFASILEMMRRYTGRTLEIDAAVYESEARTGHRNRAIGHLLRNYEVLTDDPTAAVDDYFKQCSVLVDCRDLAIMAATLANRGVNPLTGERAIRAEHVHSVLSVMASCGMYDSSGAWLYDVGMPAKSGVGGGVLAVLAGQFGIGVFSPRLDKQGNSVRAVRVCVDLSRVWELHQFNPPYCPQTSRRLSYSCAERHSTRTRRAAELACLRERGDAIRVHEVQGMLTLATTEPVVRAILANHDGVKALIIDFGYVTGVNTSAATLLADLAAAIGLRGRRLLFTTTTHLPELARIVGERLGEPAATELCQFSALDPAMESCEDEVIRTFLPTPEPPVSRSDSWEITAGMSAAELAVLESLVSCRTFRRGDRIVRQGDEAHDLFLITQGVIGVWVGEESENARRIASFSAGTMVGGMAFIDGRPRSATLVAEDVVECSVLSRDAFDGLEQSHPAMYARMLRNIAASLSAKLRHANESLSVLARRRE